jgi:uncharacterized membrane protein
MTPRLVGPMMTVLAVACMGEKSPPAAAPPAASTPAAAPAAAASPDVLVRGVIRLAPTLSFRPCDGGAQRAVLDSSNNRLVAVYRTLRAGDESGMYLLGIGAGGGNNALVLRDLEYSDVSADAECNNPAPSYQVTARGTAPAWQLTITDAGIEYSDSAFTDGVRFPPATTDDSSGWTRYRSSGGDAHTIQLITNRNGCAERSGTSYAAMQAAVTFDGRTRTGCAWRGRLR